jgi:hypothetical protein
MKLFSRGSIFAANTLKWSKNKHGKHVANVIGMLNLKEIKEKDPEGP